MKFRIMAHNDEEIEITIDGKCIIVSPKTAEDIQDAIGRALEDASDIAWDKTNGEYVREGGA